MTMRQKTFRHKSNKFSASQGPYFTISYSNIRGLRKNMPDVEAFAMTNSPSVMALCETGLDGSISEQDFTIPGY